MEHFSGINRTMERKQQQQLNESIDSVFLKENIYSLLGVPGNFDRNNKEHMDLLKKNFRSITMSLHPDSNKDNPRAAELFNHVVSAHDLLMDGGTTKDLFVGPKTKNNNTDLLYAAGVSPGVSLTRSDIDTVLNTAHGGDHWKPKEGKTISRANGLQHVLDWEEEQKQHHGKITDALRSIYNPSSGGTRRSRGERKRGATPNPSIKPTVMDRPPIRGNDTHSQYLHAALGMHETFLDPDHVGDTSPASDMHSGQFKTKNPNLAHLYRTTFSNGPRHGFVVRSPFHSEGRVQGYVSDGVDSVENFSHQTHHLSMILDPAYAQRAIASAHSSHRNFRESFRQQHGRGATDQDLDAAIKAGTIRDVGLPAEEEDQKAVQRHIHALQMAAIHHPNVHANDLVAILQRRPSTHSDTESDPFGPRGRSSYAAAYSPKLQEDKNLQELQVAAISKLLHTRQSAGRRGNFTSSITGTRVQPTPASGQFITSSRQRAADLWNQHRKDIINKYGLAPEIMGGDITAHHISPFDMHSTGGFLAHDHKGMLYGEPHQFGEELQRLTRAETSEREGHVLLGIHHPDALVRQIANAHTTNFPR